MHEKSLIDQCEKGDLNLDILLRVWKVLDQGHIT